MVGEVGRRVDEAVQTQQLDDAVEIAQRRLGLREDIKRAQPRGLLTPREVDVGAELARDRDLAILRRDLARDERQSVEMQEGDIAAERGLRIREGKVKCLEPCFDFSWHDRLRS